jgi:hypothetical protein
MEGTYFIVKNVHAKKETKFFFMLLEYNIP